MNGETTKQLLANGNVCAFGELTMLDNPEEDRSRWEPYNVSLALLIEFKSANELKKAIDDGGCEFTGLGNYKSTASGCETCQGTGWYGENGPGIIGNTEFYRCDCGADNKCRCGWHTYKLYDNIPWCRECNLEADLEVCKLHHDISHNGVRPLQRGEQEAKQ